MGMYVKARICRYAPNHRQRTVDTFERASTCCNFSPKLTPASSAWCVYDDSIIIVWMSLIVGGNGGNIFFNGGIIEF